MGEIALTAKPAMARGMRLQWEAVQSSHVLLYPEGMVKLNATAAAILSRCDAERTVSEIIADLERAYSTSGLASEILAFLALALEKHWLELRE